MTRDNVRCSGSGVNIGDLKGGRRKTFVALIPAFGAQIGQRRRGAMHGVVGALRIGDVTLHALNDKAAGQGTAPADPTTLSGFPQTTRGPTWPGRLQQVPSNVAFS